MENMSYIVLIEINGDEAYPLLVTSDAALAEAEAQEVRDRWAQNDPNSEVVVTVMEHPVDDTITFDYDWLLPDDAEEDVEYDSIEDDNEESAE